MKFPLLLLEGSHLFSQLFIFLLETLDLLGVDLLLALAGDGEAELGAEGVLGLGVLVVLVVLVHVGEDFGEELHGLVDTDALDEGVVLVAREILNFF